MQTISSDHEVVKSSAAPTSSVDFDKESNQGTVIDSNNAFILHGYDLAMGLLLTQGFKDAGHLLALNRDLIEMGLKNENIY